MDFIETIFGLSPDGGTGLFEALLFALPILGLLALWRKRRRRCRGSDYAVRRK